MVNAVDCVALIALTRHGVGMASAAQNQAPMARAYNQALKRRAAGSR